MKGKVIFFSLLILFFISSIGNAYAQVPEWVKNTAGWWADDLIPDKDFLKGIEFLLNEKIIQISEINNNQKKSETIPNWIKNNAAWWSQGQIKDSDFLNGVQFLVENGIISVESGFSKQQLFIGGFDLSQAGPIEGAKDALFTIIMFSDHQCEKCAKWLIHEKKILAEKLIQSGVAKFVILDYPMLGDDSVTAAEATYCAEEQDQYFEYYSLLNEKHSGVQNGWASFDSLVNYAVELGLNVEEFDSCLFWDQQGLRVDHNRSVALSHGVVGTPTFFVVSPNGAIEKIVGAQPPMIFERIIKEMS
ncbi:MAG: thioredoxin domain-containing protein [Nitrosopumilaceae archaeon]|jgi:protein-disulfide isomerase